MAARRVEVEVDGRALSLSNLDKVLYPEAGFTKGQVIDYYTRIAPVLLPHLRDRPLTLKRYPNGVEGQFFYEKNCPSHRPDWVRTAPVCSRHAKRTIDFCVVDDLPTLVWTANLADLELHTVARARPPTSRAPTMVVFDLDPGAPATIVECAEVALRLRELFEQLGLESFPKTSGSKGLQVYVPLNTPTTYDADQAVRPARSPSCSSAAPRARGLDMKKALRTGKVFVDWSQNDEHKTTVCVYSLRAREQPDGLHAGDLGRRSRRVLGSRDPEELVFDSAAGARARGGARRPVRAAASRPSSRSCRYRRDDPRSVTRHAEAALGVAEAVVLAVVAIALGVGEDEDAVGREGGQRVLDRDGGLGLARVAGRVDARPPRGARPCRPGPSRPPGSRRRSPTPRRRAATVRGGGDDQHLGAVDLVAQRGAQHVGVDGLRGQDEELHGADATRRTTQGEVVAQPPGLQRERPSPRWPTRSLPPPARAGLAAEEAGERPRAEGVVERARLDDAVRVEHEGVARAEHDAVRARGRGRARCRAGSRAPGLLDACRRRAARAAAGARRRRCSPRTPPPSAPQRDVERRCRSAGPGPGAGCASLSSASTPTGSCAMQRRRRASCSGRAR